MASKLQFNALETTADVFPDPRLSGGEDFIFFNFFLLRETTRRGARTRLLLTSAAVFALLIPLEHVRYIYF